MFDQEPLSAPAWNLHLTIEARRQRRFDERRDLPLGLPGSRQAGEVVISADACKALAQELALEERLRFRDVIYEDEQGRLPFETGYEGAYERPDAEGRMYWMADYAGPVPADEFATVIDLAAERERRRNIEAPPASVIPFPTAQPLAEAQ